MNTNVYVVYTSPSQLGVTPAAEMTRGLRKTGLLLSGVMEAGYVGHSRGLLKV